MGSSTSADHLDKAGKQASHTGGSPFSGLGLVSEGGVRLTEAPMEHTGALSDVQISWPSVRSAKLQIKETSLSFETT